ncbi:putative amidoligase enzyme-domain-containing protein [Hypoxylon sp. FL0890]|nr:putative amidoligase enzyme-domain-containing protein [Hypoxylon sp. FL0890]
MSSQDQIWPGARTRTFGVEFELLFPWLFVGEPDPHKDDADKLPPILRPQVPDEMRESYQRGEVWHANEIQANLYDGVAEVLKQQGLPTGVDMFDTGDFDASHWILKSDPSISEIGEDIGYKWFGVEITSPAERASPEAFQAICHTLKLLTSNFRMRANRSCGMHVHVGDGAEFMPLEHIRRVVSFFWAADPLISCLHPPRRRTNRFSQSIRERSRLANGLKPDNMVASMHDSAPLKSCIRYIGNDTRHGEEPISWRQQNKEQQHIAAFEETRQPGNFEPFSSSQKQDAQKDTGDDIKMDDLFEWLRARIAKPIKDDDDLEGLKVRIAKTEASIDKGSITPNTPYTSTRKRLVSRRFAHPRFVPEDEEIEKPKPLPKKAERDLGVFPGIEAIFSSPSSCVVNWLHQGNNVSERPNYNITPYSCWNLGRIDPDRPRTIEFRGAEGTTSGEWAEMWARICVGLTHFAIHAPVENYLSVLLNINSAASEGGAYDVIDLLDEVGLFAEAEFAERRLMENKEDFRLMFQKRNFVPI